MPTLNQFEFSQYVKTVIEEMCQQYSLHTNLDVYLDVYNATPDLFPLAMAVSTHAQIRVGDLVNADYLLVREKDLTQWESSIREYDLICILVPDTTVFPWQEQEAPITKKGSMEASVEQILHLIGENPNRGGLLETPKRVAKAWLDTWASGYSQDPADVLKVFEDGGETYDQMVTVVDIPFYSHCEHHLAPFFGTVSISYIPNGKIVGLSKLSRLADVFARRLQVQERLTDQIADALVEHLGAKGVGVVIKARHMCMESRGIGKQGSSTITTALRGAMRDEKATRAEFLRAVGH